MSDKTLAEIHEDLLVYLNSDECVDPIGYLESLELYLAAAIAALDTAELARGAAPTSPSEPESLRFKTSYTVPGLDGTWRIRGLETTNMAADGTAKLFITREDVVPAPLIGAEPVASPQHVTGVTEPEPVPSTPRVLGYIVVTEDSTGHWAADWDGQNHETKPDGLTALAEARDSGCETAKLGLLTEVVGEFDHLTGEWLTAAPTPRVWAMPEIPADVSAVRDGTGEVFRRSADPGYWGELRRRGGRLLHVGA